MSAAASLMLAACAPLGLPAAEPPFPSAIPPTVTPAPATATPAPTVTVVKPLPAAVTPAPADLALLPPALAAKLQSDVEARAGQPVSALRLIRAEAVSWPDGSLGCPQPGVFYIQVIVDGYWVVWQAADGREFDYRAAADGAFWLCAPAAGKLLGWPTVTPLAP